MCDTNPTEQGLLAVVKAVDSVLDAYFQGGHEDEVYDLMRDLDSVRTAMTAPTNTPPSEGSKVPVDSPVADCICRWAMDGDRPRLWMPDPECRAKPHTIYGPSYNPLTG